MAARPPEPRRLRVVLSGVSSDAHTWNLVFLHLLLEEHGCDVLNLGACVPDDLVVGACLESPDLLVVSSVNGHGHLDGARLIRRVREAGARVPAVIGGKLGVDGRGRADELLTAGFDVVVDDGATDTLESFVDGVRGGLLAAAGS